MKALAGEVALCGQIGNIAWALGGDVFAARLVLGYVVPKSCRGPNPRSTRRDA